MKRIIVIAAVSVLCFASCAGSNSPKTVEEFEAALEARTDEARAFLEAVEDEAEAEAYIDNFYAGIKDYCLGILKDRKAGAEVKLNALLGIADELEPEEFIAFADALPDEVKEANSTFQQRLESIRNQADTAPGSKFVDFEVNGVRFSDFVGKGKYILVDFWASWCGPCRAEVPNIKAVYEKYAGDDFDVVGLAVWDKLEDSEAAIGELGMVWNHILDCQRVPTDIYGVFGIPHIMLISPDGTIVKRNLRGAAIGEAVAEALGR